jgi:hypothetical protein
MFRNIERKNICLKDSSLSKDLLIGNKIYFNKNIAFNTITKAIVNTISAKV